MYYWYGKPSVCGGRFLQTIDEVGTREKFKLFNLVNNPSTNNIQCFLERAQQLLAPDSVMGVIVPSSILSNSDSIHIATREILLQHFDFLSIVTSLVIKPLVKQAQIQWCCSYAVKHSDLSKQYNLKTVLIISLQIGKMKSK